jgi:OmpR family response regulator RpaB
MPRVLLIDDDERLAAPLKEYMGRFEFELINATHPQAGLEMLAKENVDLVILDVMLPDQNGFDVCRTIRRTSDVPIVMLTARGEVMDRIVGLELGADDYLPKPFEPRELVVRIQNVLKRTRQPQPREAALRFDDLEIDLDYQEVRMKGNKIDLTTLEYQLLSLLAGAPGKSFSRDEILNKLRGIDVDIYTRSVDILVSRLRKKLRPTQYIKTVWGSGYSFIAARR